MKAMVARYLANLVKDKAVIGLGSGTTAEMAIDQIGQRISREHISVSGVPTSYRTGLVASDAGIHVIPALHAPVLSWAFDGADEVDPQLNLIKGRGAAMLNEKIIAKLSKHLVIIISEEKLVPKLGTNFAVPIEIIPESLQLVRAELKNFGARDITLREAVNKYGPVVTEHNNLILDAWFDEILPSLENSLKSITGVVETGLFCGFNPEVLVAKSGGVFSLRLVEGKVREEKVEIS